MRESSLIRNRKAIDWGLNIQEAYLFSWIYELPSWASKVTIEGEVFYFCAKSKISEELPLLSSKIDTIYRYLKSLSEKELIKITKVDNRDYVCITQKGVSWNESDSSEKNPSKLGKKSEFSSEKNPTDNYTIYNNYSNDKQEKNEKKFHSKNGMVSERINPSEKHGYNNTVIEENVSSLKSEIVKYINSNTKQIFLDKYKKENGTDFYFSPKEAGKLKSIAEKVLFKMREKNNSMITVDDLNKAINFFIEVSWDINDKYIQSNFSLSVLDSNFNSIFIKIKERSNGKSKQTPIQSTRQRVRDWANS